jgi:hypothetical protein
MKPFVRPVEAKRVPARLGHPIRSEDSLFLVGRNDHGNWVARNQSGLRGGLFVGRADALKFALSQNGNRPEAVIMVAGALELDMSVSPRRRSRRHGAADAHRRVA